MLHALLHDAPYYHYLIEPSDIRGNGPIWRSIQSHLERLLFLGTESVHPYLLHCIARIPAFSGELFEDPPDTSPPSKENESSTVSLSEFDGILALLETYFVRREICQRSRQEYDQLFCLLCPQDGEQISRELLISMFASLPIVHACPSSDEFEDTLRGEVYVKGSDNRIIWVIMTSLEEYFRKYPHHDVVNEVKTQSDMFDHYMLFEDDDDFIIDHIMPCEMSDWWKSHLGESWPVIHPEYVNTLGNLTLTPRNPLLSRASFDQKQRWYAQDQMALNKPILTVQMWRKIQIEQRSQSLIALCLKIWPDITKGSAFIPVSYADCECLRVGDIPNHLRPVRVVIRGEEMPVRYWYQVLEWTVETLYAAERRKFPRVPERYPRIFSEDPTHFKSIIGKWSYQSRLGRYQIRDLCLGMLETLGWQKEDWCLVCE